jgi:hypothetical protein
MKRKDSSSTPPASSAAVPFVERSDALLLAVAAIALAPRLWLSLRLPLSHNGAWHLFAARNLAREFRGIAHPPLFPLLLKACDALSRSLLSYRFFPLIAGVGSVYLMGRILKRLGCGNWASTLGALALAVSTAAIAISVVVEGHSLCGFFVLAAFYFYLDLVQVDHPPSRRSRLGFAATASLALVSEYAGGLFLLAGLAAPVLAYLASREYRRRIRPLLRDRIGADVLTLAAPALIGAVQYLFLARGWIRELSGPSSGLPLFYLATSKESLWKFWIHNLSRTANLFAPVHFSRHGAVALAGFLLLVLILSAVGRKKPTLSGRGFPALVFAALLAIVAVLGALNAYPFGGTHRHQLLLLLFAILAGAVAFDSVVKRLRSWARPTVVALVFATLISYGIRNRHGVYFVNGDEPLNVRAGIYAQELAAAGTVHVDQMNLVGVFMDYYSWKCRFAGRLAENPPIERYDLASDDRHLTVVVHRWIWVMDFRNEALYRELRASVSSRVGVCEIAFCVDRNLYNAPRTPRPDAERMAIETGAPKLARAAGFQMESLRVTDDLVSAKLCVEP